jgi:hypothetical protein
LPSKVLHSNELAATKIAVPGLTLVLVGAVDRARYMMREDGPRRTLAAARC